RSRQARRHHDPRRQPPRGLLEYAENEDRAQGRQRRRRQTDSQMKNESVSRTVLVVDDDRATRAVLGDVLVAGGWKPMMAASGAEARQVLLSPESPRVVLLDWLLPDMPGIAL